MSYTAKGIPTGEYAAQYELIDGGGVSKSFWENIPFLDFNSQGVAFPNVDPSQYPKSDVNSCGPVALSSIINYFAKFAGDEKGVKAQEVFRELISVANAEKPEERFWYGGSLTLDQLDLVAEKFGLDIDKRGTAYKYNEDGKQIPDEDEVSTLEERNKTAHQIIAEGLNEKKPVLALVSISDDTGLLLSETQKVQHWVVVTGLSENWKEDDPTTQWVRVMNPFNNQEEFYDWKTFSSSLEIGSNKTANLGIVDWKEDES